MYSVDDQLPLIEAGEQQADVSDFEHKWVRLRHVIVAAPPAFLVCFLMVYLAMLSTAGNGRFAQREGVPENVPDHLTPRQLFESRRFTEVATDNFMVIAHGTILPEDREQAKSQIADRFRNISAALWAQYPDSGSQLDQVVLTPEEQEAFLTMMRSISNARVQRLGRDVGAALHHSIHMSMDGHHAKQQLANCLASRLSEIAQLRDEVIPQVIRSYSRNDGTSILTIDPDGISFTKRIRDWKVEIDMSVPQREPVSVLSKGRRLFIGGSQGKRRSGNRTPRTAGSSMDDMLQLLKMHAQAQKFFLQVQEFAAAKYNLHIPDMNEALRGVDTSQVMTCLMQAAMTQNLMTVMQCGMQFWSIAMDVLQNVFHSIGPVTTTTRRTMFKRREDMFDAA